VESYGHSYLTVLNAVDRPDISFRINAVLVVANVGLNIILIYAYGWYGAAIATLVASCLSLILSYAALSALMDGIQTPISEVFKQIFSATVMAIVIFLLKSRFSGNIYHTIGIVFVGVVLYFGCLLYISSDIREKILSLSPINLTKYI
jgi:O-antigen/teichoic acid export membrane protein